MTRKIGLMLGVALLLVTQLTESPAGMSAAAWKTAGVGLLMAVWWATEAIPVPATSLLPLVLFPLLGITEIGQAAAPYSHPIIFLLLGGFIIATALQRWQLHRRLALTILVRVGERPQMIVAGFMGVTAFLSMWISNTATTIMMIPIALSLAHLLMADSAAANTADGRRFTLCLLLGIAYAASIGGLGTLVGTPPNAMVAAFVAETYQREISFVQWMMLGLPTVLLLVPLAWWLLTHWVYRFDLRPNRRSVALISGELAKLGPLARPEKRTALVFAAVALAWVTRPLLQQLPGLGALNDTIIAVGGALSMFLIPAGDSEDNGARLLNWEAAVMIPWGVLLLFGGGLSLATMVSQTGLAEWLGQALALFAGWHRALLLLALVTMVIFLTELTSNVATTATLLPVLAGIALTTGVEPMLLMAPMAMAASCAFMLPVATAPNAIVYGSGEVSIPYMIKAGFWLNLVGIGVISGLCYWLIPVAGF